MSAPTKQDVASVKRRHENRLLRLANVIGVGIGNKVQGGKQLDELSIKVYVSKKQARDQLPPDQIIPEQLEGFKTDVEEMEPPTALEAATPS